MMRHYCIMERSGPIFHWIYNQIFSDYCGSPRTAMKHAAQARNIDVDFGSWSKPRRKGAAYTCYGYNREYGQWVAYEITGY